MISSLFFILQAADKLSHLHIYSQLLLYFSFFFFSNQHLPKMFDIIFGWRKASKCKKLIRRVQCRLKLLKNKRSTIVRQLREDVAELLKHGHRQAAFDRVEQLFKDECLVAVYDLLDQFCEFITINLPYIGRNKDCPNDINEAVSSLIFASARFGDLPELRSIRKLFGERYGQRLATVALELLPGNFVNRQMKEKISIKSVSDDVKSRLVEEILRSSLQSGPLLLEYSSEKQQKLANESTDGPILSAKTINERIEGDNLDEYTTEGKIVYANFSSEKKFLKDLPPSLLSSKTTFPSTYSIRVQETPLKTSESSILKKHLASSARKFSPCDNEISGFQHLEGELVVYDSALGLKEGSAVVESFPGGLTQLPEEMICLDDIQEFESPLSKEGNLQDQRLFKFKSSVLPVRGKTDNPNDEAPDQDQYDSDNENAASRSFRKSRNIISGKRLRRRSVSGDATSMHDIGCAIYYGESTDSSPNYDKKSYDRRKHQKKIPIKQQQKVYYAQEIPIHPHFIEVRNNFSNVKCTDDHIKLGSRCSFNNKMLNNCSLEHPCYICTGDEKDDWNYSPRKLKVQFELWRCHCSCNKRSVQFEEAEKGTLPNQTTNKSEDATSPTLLISSSSGVGSPWTSKEGKPSYPRALTMPPEKPREAAIDSMLRSNSCPFKEPESSPNRHVHPKLPDYDELAAKFMALKKANLQK